MRYGDNTIFLKLTCDDHDEYLRKKKLKESLLTHIKIKLVFNQLRYLCKIK